LTLLKSYDIFINRNKIKIKKTDMKKVILALSVISFLVSCEPKGETTTETTVDSTAVDSTQVVDSVKVDSTK
jgi:hypothetical protein